VFSKLKKLSKEKRNGQKNTSQKKGRAECPSSIEPISIRGFSRVCATHLAPSTEPFSRLIPSLSSTFALVSSNV
jgi:hypothetical protein